MISSYILEEMVLYKDYFESFKDFMLDAQFVRTGKSVFSGILGDNFILKPEENVFILSIGGGRTPSTHVSFPNIRAYTNDHSVITGKKSVYIIAMDVTFENEAVRNEYCDLVQSIFATSQIIKIALINTKIPKCKNKDEIGKTALALRRPHATFNYFRSVNCILDDSNEYYNKLWLHLFINLVSRINVLNCDLCIHNDAWFNKLFPFGEEFVWKRVENLGINFEVIAIIPRILICFFNPAKLYRLQNDNIYPFFSNKSISPIAAWYAPSTTDVKKAMADYLVKLGLDPFNTASEESVEPRCDEFTRKDKNLGAASGGSGSDTGAASGGSGSDTGAASGAGSASTADVKNQGGGRSRKSRRIGRRITCRRKSRRFKLNVQ